METCSNCGAAVKPTAKYCTSCGTRLNEPVDNGSPASWPSSASDAAEHTQALATVGDADSSSSADDTVAESDAEPDSGTDEASDAFSWSWGQSTDDPDPVLDEESGIEETPVEHPNEEPAPDMTEEGLVDDETEPADDADSPGQNEPAPDTSDAELVLDEDDDEHDGSQETLAAWATQWESSAPAPLDEAGELPSSAGTGGSEPDDDGGEDTVAKAERLIGELRSIIPSLARPKPAQPSSRPAPTHLADSLDRARQAADWSDLRAALDASKGDPRDIDTMIALSGRIDQLLALLDDRDQLAKTAEDVANQLRESKPEPSIL